MKVWILTIQILGTNIEYGYKFIYKSNCQTVGKSIIKKSKQMKYYCENKYLQIKKK